MKRWLSVLAACGLAMTFSTSALAQVPHVTGGVGDEEREALQAQAKDYNLQLLFAIKGSGEYIASVKLSIFDNAGKPLLAAEGAGPWFYARLPEGRYQVVAETAGNRQVRWVMTSPDKPTKVYFYWPEANGGGR